MWGLDFIINEIIVTLTKPKIPPIDTLNVKGEEFSDMWRKIHLLDFSKLTLLFLDYATNSTTHVPGVFKTMNNK